MEPEGNALLINKRELYLISTPNINIVHMTQQNWNFNIVTMLDSCILALHVCGVMVYQYCPLPVSRLSSAEALPKKGIFFSL